MILRYWYRFIYFSTCIFFFPIFLGKFDTVIVNRPSQDFITLLLKNDKRIGND